MSIPRMLLSCETVLGVTRHPRERAIALGRSFSEPGALAAAFKQGLEAGADGVLAPPAPVTRAALETIGQQVPVWAVLPNVPAYVRDSAEAGLVGAALKRVRGANAGALARLGMTAMRHALGVVAGDFASLLPLLLELEAAALGARRVEGVVVAAPITDLALAGRHRRFFAHVTDFVRARFGASAGFETHNIGHLLARLRGWGVRPDVVIGPLNPRGFMMKPTPARVLEELAISDVPVLAKELTAGGTVPLDEAAAWARKHALAGLVVDLADVNGDARALATLRAPVHAR